jgi:hypothetical protein
MGTGGLMRGMPVKANPPTRWQLAQLSVNMGWMCVAKETVVVPDGAG